MKVDRNLYTLINTNVLRILCAISVPLYESIYADRGQKGLFNRLAIEMMKVGCLYINGVIENLLSNHPFDQFVVDLFN